MIGKTSSLLFYTQLSKVIKILKKMLYNSFIGGTIFGSIFSLIINIVTIHTQETMQNQRVLEALENEIVNHEVQAANAITINDDEIKTNKRLGFLHDFKKYPNSVWSSSEALKYIFQLDPSVQNNLMAYYNVTIDGWNSDLEKNNDWSKQNMTTCYFPIQKNSDEEQKTCDDVYSSLLQNESFIAGNLGQSAINTLKVFHPTHDRLNNFTLRLLMGTNARGVLADR